MIFNEEQKPVKVYDFDKTIYDGDCTIDFYIYALKRNPKVFFCFPIQCFAVIMMKLGLWKKEKAKSLFFVFLRMIRDTDGVVCDFWDRNIDRIKKWYISQKSDSDIIITASPQFLVREAASRLGNMKVIASECDKKTGRFISQNCYGEEKVRRFHEEFGDLLIDEFYSDSYSDFPMASISKKSFIVNGEDISVWHI